MSEVNKPKGGVLEFVWHSEPIGTKQFPDAVVVTAGPAGSGKLDFYNDLSEPLPPELWGKYDVVLASHVLEHIRRRHIPETVKRLAMALKPGGELWLVTHALEAAMGYLALDKPSPVVLPILYGPDTENRDEDYKIAFTLVMLRMAAVDAGLIPKMAEQRPIEISINKKPYDSILNWVIAVKPEDWSSDGQKD